MFSFRLVEHALPPQAEVQCSSMSMNSTGALQYFGVQRSTSIVQLYQAIIEYWSMIPYIHIVPVVEFTVDSRDTPYLYVVYTYMYDGLGADYDAWS